MASLAFRRCDFTGILERNRPNSPIMPMESRKPSTALRSRQYQDMPKGMVSTAPQSVEGFPGPLRPKPKFMSQPPSFRIKQLVHGRQLFVQTKGDNPILRLDDEVTLGDKHLPPADNGAQDYPLRDMGFRQLPADDGCIGRDHNFQNLRLPSEHEG